MNEMMKTMEKLKIRCIQRGGVFRKINEKGEPYCSCALGAAEKFCEHHDGEIHNWGKNRWGDPCLESYRGCTLPKTK